MTENIEDGSMTGQTAQCLQGMQFEALKKGDRFWHETRETVENADGKKVNIGFTEGNCYIYILYLRIDP